MERPGRETSTFFFSLSRLHVRKAKQKSAFIIHSMEVSLGSLEVNFLQIGETRDRKRKLMSLTRIGQTGDAKKEDNSLKINLDVLKAAEGSVRKQLNVRGSVGSIQGVFTIHAVLELLRLGQKFMDHSFKTMFIQHGLLRFLEGTGSSDRPDSVDFSDEEFKSFRNNNNSMIASLTQSWRADSNLIASMIGSPDDQLAKSSLPMDELEEAMKNLILDIDLSLQGLYVALLKEPVFVTADMFSWVTEAEAGSAINFHEILGSYFMLRVGEVLVGFDPKKNLKEITVESLDLADFELLGPQAKEQNDIGLFSNRVVIQGLDESGHSLDVSHSSDDFDGGFKSVRFSTVVNRYRSHILLSLDKLPKDKDSLTRPSTSIRVTLGNEDPVSVRVAIAPIRVEVDVESITFFASREAFYQEVLRVGQLLDHERKKSQLPNDRNAEAIAYYGGSMTSDMRAILQELESILKLIASNESYRKKVLELFQLPDLMDVDLMSAERSKSSKIYVDLAGIIVRVGGLLNEKSDQSAWLELKMGAAKVLIHQQIVLSWKNKMTVTLEDAQKTQHLIMSVVCDKENVIGIDKGICIVKISAAELNYSPAIFESILLFVNVIDSRLIKSQFYLEKYQLFRNIVEQQELAASAYKIFAEEVSIAKVLADIDAAVNKLPDFVSKVYFYLGRLSVKIFDEQITRDIIESSIAQRKVDVDDWTVMDDDGNLAPLKKDIDPEVEMLEARLQQTPVVVHLDLKPIMIRVQLAPSDFTMMVHTILLRDGMTYISATQKENYQTHFIELMSINHDQPVFDAHLSQKTFDINTSVKHFKEVYKRFKEQGPFLELNRRQNIEEQRNRCVDLTTVAVSSVILRLANQTSKEIFLCLIRIVDDTLVRLDRLAQVVALAQTSMDSDEIKAYRKKREEMSEKATSGTKQQRSVPARTTLSLDRVFLDIFNPNEYRVVLEIKETSMAMDDDPDLQKPTTLSCKDIGLYFAINKEATLTRSLDIDSRKADFFKVVTLQTLQLQMTEALLDGVPTQTIVVNMPMVNNRNLFILLDIDSIKVLLQISRNFDLLLTAAQKKSVYLFKDFTEYSSKNPEVSERRDKGSFVPVGLKYPEMLTIRERFNILKGGIILDDSDFEIDASANNNTEIIQEKLKVAQKAIDEIYIEQLGGGKQSTVVQVWIEMVTVNVYQRFDARGHSYVSLKIMEALVASRINHSRDHVKKSSTKTITTSSAVLSIKSIKVLNHTINSMFKHLLKIPRHSLCLFARSREVAEQTIDCSSVKPKTLVKSYKDKIALVVDMKPIQISIDDKSVSSLRDFAEQLSLILNPRAAANDDSRQTDDASLASESRMLLDYLSIEKISIQLMSRSATNLSIVNYIPDININISEKYYDFEEPVTQAELLDKFRADIEKDLSVVNLVKDNKMNLPLLASFVSVVGSLSSIYSAVSARDGRGVIIGVRDLSLWMVLVCVKTGQFGVKALADLTRLVGSMVFGIRLDWFKDINLSIEKLIAKLKGNGSAGFKKNLDSGAGSGSTKKKPK